MIGANMDITFNFIGMSVANWPAAHTFFTQSLGLQAELNPAYGDWANLGGGWSGYYSDTHSLVCELFDNGGPVATRWWGHHQNIRPAIHVDDLDATVNQLRGRGIHFAGEIENRSWGRQIEFDTVEGIKWAIAQIPSHPMRHDLSRPHIGHVAIKTADFKAQQDFYERILGLELRDSGQDHAIYTQNKPNHPFIILLTGGEVVHYDPDSVRPPERAHPFFLSLMTPELSTVLETINQQGLALLRSVTHHADWGGTDVVIKDADGNAIQIVQYP